MRTFFPMNAPTRLGGYCAPTRTLDHPQTYDTASYFTASLGHYPTLPHPHSLTPRAVTTAAHRTAIYSILDQYSQ